MDDSTRYHELFESLEEQRRRLGETASKFPPTAAEYLEKDTEARLSLAKNILKEYRNVPRYGAGKDGGNNWEQVKVKPTDRPGNTLVGKVAYHPEHDPGYMERERKPEGIAVNVRAHDPQTGENSDSLDLGELREGTYRDAEGEQRVGWHVWIGGSGNDTVTAVLDSQRGQEMVEFVDAAVIGVIEGVITEHRKFLGSQALEGAAQP